MEQVTQPDGRVLKSYYSKLKDERLVVLRYNDYESTPKFYGPVHYTVTNHAGKAEVQAVVSLTGNESTSALTAHVDETDSDPITAMDLGTVAQMTTSLYTDTGGSVTETRLYHTVPTSGAGSDGTNYDPTLFGYDDMGQRTRVKEPHGTIYRTVYDIHGRVTERWMGTNDNSFDGGESSGPDDMVKTEALEYDSGTDDGNGYLTKRTLYVEDSATDKRETSFSNDLRGRALLETRPEKPHAFHKVDNMGRRTATGLFSSTASMVVGTDDPTTETTNRLALSQIAYDEMGRVWRTKRHEILSNGTDNDNLETQHVYDAVGRLIKTDGSQLAKTLYDRLGRRTHQFILASTNDTGYSDADDVTGDIVLEEYQTLYESSNSDDVVMRVDIARNHDDYGAGETNGALDSNADTDDLLLTAANVEGRPQITALWYDRFGRVTDTVLYGNYGNTNFDRDGLTVPSRSDTALRTTNTYNTDGTLQKVEDPRSLVTYSEYDDAGRKTKDVRHYDATVNSGNPSGTDDNQTVKYEYTDGLRTKITADLPSGSTDQVTLYIYGTTDGTPTASKVSSGHLLRAEVYPDSTNTGTTEANINSDDSDVASFAYNAQGQQVYKKDQAGNVIETDFDDAGRVQHSRVTTLASGFDGAVKRISTTYTDSARAELVTSYDNATVGSGSVVNEVKYAYDGWGGITSFKQDKNSAVGASGFYEVSYTYAKATAGRNTVKRSAMTLPSGNVITYIYGSAGGLHDSDTSRVTQVKDGAVVLSSYLYNGIGQVVAIDYPQPDIMSQEHGATSGSYPDLDRFNRVTSSRWTSDLGTDVDFYDVDVAYDRNSNVTLIEDNVHTGFDVDYAIDDLDRLIQAEEGTWNGFTITSKTRDQLWTLDHIGNWDIGKLDLNGDGDFVDTDEYNDDRTHNDVNEQTARDTDDDGTDDYALTHDAVGNLTDDAETYKYEYDALRRLRRVKDQSDNLVAEYKYNGLGHIIAIHEDTDNDGDVDANDKWFYPAHDERWRMVGYFREDDTDPKEEFVNHQAGIDGHGKSSYINGVICRDKDANTAWTAASDGVLEERGYYCQNWRGDVVAVVHSSRKLMEWIKYMSYGIPFGLPGGDTDSDGDCDGTDVTQIQTWIDTSTYDIRGDADLSGVVDGADKSFVQNNLEGTTLGLQKLSGGGNRRGFAGQEHDMNLAGLLHARNRGMQTGFGRWNQRDPMEYADNLNMYEYVGGRPITFVDPMGLQMGGRDWSSFYKDGKPEHYGKVDPLPLTAFIPWYGTGVIAGGHARRRDGPSAGAPAGNLMMHCVASCDICKSLGEGIAELAGDLVEFLESIGLKKGGNKDTPLDQLNNAAGRMCCTKLSFMTCEECCWLWWSSSMGVQAGDIPPSVFVLTAELTLPGVLVGRAQ